MSCSIHSLAKFERTVVVIEKRQIETIWTVVRELAGIRSSELFDRRHQQSRKHETKRGDSKAKDAEKVA